MIKIEEGKFYRRRDGEIVGPIDHLVMRAVNGFNWCAAGEPECSWRDDGKHLTTRESVLDLVEEVSPAWIDAPIGGRTLDEAVAAATAYENARLDSMVAAERMTKVKLLDAAKATVADRGTAYGGVEDNFGRIARLWSAHLLNRTGTIFTFTPDDVVQMMVLMKVARLENQPNHLDSWTDIAGYAACGAEITQDLPKAKKSA